MASVTMASVIMAKVFMAKVLWQMKLSPFWEARDEFLRSFVEKNS